MVEQVVGVIQHLIQATGKPTTKGWMLVTTEHRILLTQFGGSQMQEALAMSKARAKGFMAILLAGKVLLPQNIWSIQANILR